MEVNITNNNENLVCINFSYS